LATKYSKGEIIFFFCAKITNVKKKKTNKMHSVSPLGMEGLAPPLPQEIKLAGVSMTTGHWSFSGQVTAEQKATKEHFATICI
jgi:hypothetical protein